MDPYIKAQIKNYTIGIVTGLFSVLFAVLPLQLILLTGGKITNEMPVTPEDFTPAVRIIAFTDSHNRNERVAEAVDTAYELFDNDSGVTLRPARRGSSFSYQTQKCTPLGVHSAFGGEGETPPSQTLVALLASFKDDFMSMMSPPSAADDVSPLTLRNDVVRFANNEVMFA